MENVGETCEVEKVVHTCAMENVLNAGGVDNVDQLDVSMNVVDKGKGLV